MGTMYHKRGHNPRCANDAATFRSRGVFSRRWRRDTAAQFGVEVDQLGTWDDFVVELEVEIAVYEDIVVLW